MVKNSMKNLIREEFFKTKKSKTLYICLTVAVCILIFLALLYQNNFPDYHWIDFESEIPWSLNFATFVMIFALVYVCNEFAQGTIKNYIAIGFSRTKIYLSKLIKIAIITFGMVFLLQLIALIFAPFFMGTSVDFKANLIYYLYGLLAIMEVVCFYVALAFITKRLGAVLGIYFGLSIFYSLLSTLSLLLSDSAILNVFSNIFKYTYFESQINLAVDLANGVVTSPIEVVLAILVPIIVIGVSTFGGILMFNKQDVK